MLTVTPRVAPCIDCRRTRTKTTDAMKSAKYYRLQDDPNTDRTATHAKKSAKDCRLHQDQNTGQLTPRNRRKVDCMRTRTQDNSRQEIGEILSTIRGPEQLTSRNRRNIVHYTRTRTQDNNSRQEIGEVLSTTRGPEHRQLTPRNWPSADDCSWTRTWR